ncbi:MAG: hypothetical protein A2Z93_01765 [Curvibacter sp. GWA2_64_110]|nr:MAG: hypothetical protein A2Z93_01765 [Curvibacter sp. GWA2_64_110]
MREIVLELGQVNFSHNKTGGITTPEGWCRKQYSAALDVISDEVSPQDLQVINCDANFAHRAGIRRRMITLKYVIKASLFGFQL